MLGAKGRVRNAAGIWKWRLLYQWGLLCSFKNSSGSQDCRSSVVVHNLSLCKGEMPSLQLQAGSGSSPTWYTELIAAVEAEDTFAVGRASLGSALAEGSGLKVEMRCCEGKWPQWQTQIHQVNLILQPFESIVAKSNVLWWKGIGSGN